MSMVERTKISVNMNINIDTSPIATFHWNEAMGKRLRGLREENNYSRRELSERTGVSEAYIQQLESPHLYAGRSRKPKELTASRKILESLCLILKTNVAALIWDGNVGNVIISSEEGNNSLTV